MKISCEKYTLNEAISAAIRATSAKSSMPALSGILLSAKNNTLTLTGYDLEMGITCTMEATVYEEGAIILDAHFFGDIVRKLSGNTVVISTNHLTTNIKGDFSDFNIMGMAAMEFPEMPSVIEEKSISLPENMLKSMIRQTIFAVSTNESKPVHTGLLFEIKDNVLKTVGVDGFRLAIREEKLKSSCEDLSFIIPGKTLNEIIKFLNDTDNLITLKLSKKHIIFEIGTMIIISRLLEGKFLDYHTVIPNEIFTTVKVDTKRVIDSIEALSVLINEKLKSPIRCNIIQNELKLSINSATGNGVEEIKATIKGNDIEIGFNNRFMLDALKASESDTVILEFNTNVFPIKITSEKDNGFLFLVLPVRLKAE